MLRTLEYGVKTSSDHTAPGHQAHPDSQENLRTFCRRRLSFYKQCYGRSSPSSPNKMLSTPKTKPSRTAHEHSHKERAKRHWPLCAPHESPEAGGVWTDPFVTENIRLQTDRWISERKQSELRRALGAEMKFAMCVINERGKRLRPGSSEERLTQAVANNERIVTKIVENHERTTVDNNVHFEIPVGEVGFQTKPTNKV